jgi:hypothetical protein
MILFALSDSLSLSLSLSLNVVHDLWQVTRAEPKSSAVVKHQGVFFKITSNAKRLLRAAQAALPLFSDFPACI